MSRERPIFTEDKDEIIRNVYKTREVPVAMGIGDVREMDSLFRVGGGKKSIFGRSIEEWVREGLMITKDMYRTTTFGPVAVETAHRLRNILEVYFPKRDKDQYRGIEGCTGSGSQTWAFAHESHRLWVDATVEIDPVVALFTRRNLESIGLKKIGNVVAITDIREYLNAQIAVNNGNGMRHDWVYVDPDWEGKPYRFPQKSFSFNDMSPNGNQLIELGLKVAPVVGIKAPEKVTDDEINEVALLTNTVAVVQKMNVSMMGERLNEKAIYFLNRPDIVQQRGTGIIENISLSILG